MNRNKLSASVITIILFLGFMLTAAPLWAADDEKIQQQREDIRKMANDTLARLYKTQPSAQKAIGKADGCVL